jgi:DDE domain
MARYWKEGGIESDHVTIYRWVHTFTPEFIDAARPARHAAGDPWFLDETYVKVAGRWSYLYRAVDQHRQACVDPASGLGELVGNVPAARDTARFLTQNSPPGHRIRRKLDQAAYQTAKHVGR